MTEYTNKLRYIRQQKGITPRQLSQLSGYSQPYISRLERGQRPFNQDNIKIIAKALDCDPKELADVKVIPPVNNIRAIRRTKKLTIIQLAEKTNYSPSYLSRLETGKKKLTPKVLKQLSSALGCSAKKLEDVA